MPKIRQCGFPSISNLTSSRSNMKHWTNHEKEQEQEEQEETYPVFNNNQLRKTRAIPKHKCQPSNSTMQLSAEAKTTSATKMPTTMMMMMMMMIRTSKTSTCSLFTSIKPSNSKDNNNSTRTTLAVIMRSISLLTLRIITRIKGILLFRANPHSNRITINRIDNRMIAISTKVKITTIESTIGSNPTWIMSMSPMRGLNHKEQFPITADWVFQR